MSAELHWFPIYYVDWLASAAISAMLPEQEGAYMRLLMIAWGNGEAEPSLSTSPVALAQMSRLGARWKKLGALIVEQFDERDGRLYHAKLSEVWREQQEKHAAAVTKGRKGGETRAANRKRGASSATSPAGSSATAEGVAGTLPTQNSEGLVPPAPSGAGEEPCPAPGGALAPEGAALTGATSGTGDYLDRPSVRDALLRRGVRVGQPAGAPPVPIDDGLHRRHYAALREAADRWIAANPDDAKQLGRNLRQHLGLPLRGELPPAKERVLRECVYTEVARVQQWASAEDWDGAPFTVLEVASA